MRKLVFGLFLIILFSTAIAKERPYLPLADLTIHSSCAVALGAEERGDDESIGQVNTYILDQFLRLEAAHPDQPQIIKGWLTNTMVDQGFLPELVMFYCRDFPQKTIFSAVSTTYQWLINREKPHQS